MKERPILFSGPMVQAILDRRKTQTRRVVSLRGEALAYFNSLSDPGLSGRVKEWCPYGKPGDRLWVRETWRTAKSLDDLSPHGMANKAIEAGWKRPWAPIKYEADGAEINTNTMFGAEWGKTRVSIHMPRWASRITLEVTEVRVQRLQEISEEDAKAEGVEAVPFCKAGRPDGMEHVEAFEDLWQKINGERPGGSWKANPWVLAITFKVLP